MIDEQEDFWRQIPGLEAYWVSRDGQVRKRVLLKSGAIKITTVKLRPGPNGYLRFNARRGLYEYCWPEVHRCMALAFHGEPPFEGAHAAHDDGNCTNNIDTNIKWKTRSENMRDRTLHGGRITRLSIEERSKILLLRSEGISAAGISQILGRDNHTVRRVLRSA